MDDRNAIGLGCLGLAVVVAWLWIAVVNSYGQALAIGSFGSFLCGS